MAAKLDLLEFPLELVVSLVEFLKVLGMLEVKLLSHVPELVGLLADLVAVGERVVEVLVVVVVVVVDVVVVVIVVVLWDSSREPFGSSWGSYGRPLGIILGPGTGWVWEYLGRGATMALL